VWINFLNSYSAIALCAFVLENIFGSIKFKFHPVYLLGKYIRFFENHFYKDSIFTGFILCVSTIIISIVVVVLIKLLLPEPYWLIFEVIFASVLLANKLLYTEVKKVALSDNPKQKLKYLVSRDVDRLNSSDVYKATIETYAENLNDAVIAPLFYLLLFGIWGIVVYKAVNTLDSMVGYRNSRYEKFGKISARFDDVLNFIPARLTAVLVLLLNKKLKYIKHINYLARHYPSFNAVYPIGAFAYSLEICLGGPSVYFGKTVFKPTLGYNKCTLDRNDVLCALNQKTKIDIAIFLVLLSFVILENWRLLVK